MTQTRSPMSLAATANDEANVLLPDPPFWVTKAIVRMEVRPFPFIRARGANRGPDKG